MSEIFLIKNFIYFIPSLNDLLSFFLLLLLTISFCSYGQIISNIGSSFNFFIGWSFFYFVILLLNFYLGINLNVIISTFILIGLFYAYKNFDRNFFINFFKENKILTFFSIIYLFLLISSNTKEWDSFAFWGLNINYLIEHGFFPLADNQFKHVHGNNPQTFGASFIVYTASMFNDNLSENSSAIFNFISLFMFFLILKKNFINSNNQYFLILLIFLNPFIINSKTFSLYNDFSISIVISVIYIFLFKQLFFKKEGQFFNDKRFWISLFLLFNLLYLIKSTGFVNFIIFIFVTSILLLYEKKSNDLIKLLLIFVITISFFFLFKYILGIDSNYSFFRNSIRINLLDEILLSSIFNFLSNKIYVLFYILIFILFLSNLFTKKLSNDTIFIFLTLIFWLGFIIFSYLVFFVKSEAINAHSFNRYLSQINMLILTYAIISYNNLSINYKIVEKFFSSKVILYISILTVLVTPILISDKLRRDLQYPLVNITNLNKLLNFKDYKNIFVVTDNRAYISHVLKFYSNKSKFSIYDNKSENIPILEKIFKEFDLILYITKGNSCYIDSNYENRNKNRCNNSLLQ